MYIRYKSINFVKTISAWILAALYTLYLIFKCKRLYCFKALLTLNLFSWRMNASFNAVAVPSRVWGLGYDRVAVPKTGGVLFPGRRLHLSYSLISTKNSGALITVPLRTSHLEHITPWKKRTAKPFLRRD